MAGNKCFHALNVLRKAFKRVILVFFQIFFFLIKYLFFGDFSDFDNFAKAVFVTRKLLKMFGPKKNSCFTQHQTKTPKKGIKFKISLKMKLDGDRL